MTDRTGTQTTFAAPSASMASAAAAPSGAASFARRFLCRVLLGLFLMAAVLVPSMRTRAASGNMQITPIDFGPATWGDATIVSSGGRNLLMDTCNIDTYDTILNYLSTHNFFSFDIYISHYHYDHMYQVVPILNDSRFHVSTLYLPDPAYLKKGADNGTYCDMFYDGYLEIEKAAKAKGVHIVYLKKGSTFTIGNAKFEVLWGCNYNNGAYDTHYINNNSLVTRVTSGDTVYLTCGDIEKAVENQLVASGINLRADIFKFSHHGGNTSNSASFVKKVNPSFSYYNYNGDSPSTYGKGWVAASVANLQDISNIYSSRYNGMLTFSVKSGHISVAGERNMQAVTYNIKDNKGSVVNTVTYQFNKADKHVLTSRMKATAATVSTANSKTSIPARIKSGTWKKTSKGWRYYDSKGTLIKGKFVTISGKTYYLNKSGFMVTGWQTIGGKRYYFESTGEMLYRWKRVNGKKYLFDYLDGHMHTGWVQENGKWYYLDPKKGYLVTGWITVNKKKYYMQSDFTMVAGGWKKISGKYYYFNKKGEMQTGWLKVGTLNYYLASNGQMLTGTHTIGGRKYTFNSSGVLQGKAPNSASSSSASSGSKKLTGWQTIKGKTYYYDENGTKLLRWKRIDGKKYYLDPKDGHLHTGWVYCDDTSGWYYMDPAAGGAMTYGSKKIGSDYYYLNTSDGKMLTNAFATVNGVKYYYGASGARVKKAGFVKSGSNWYLLDSAGKITTGWKTNNGKKYYMNSKGVMQENTWINTNGYWYYVDGSGAMVTGSKKINGTTYKFSSKGRLSGVPTAVSSESSASWAAGTDSDMSYNVTSAKSQAFVNEMLTYATFFDGKISYGSSQNGTDPNNLRYERLRSGGTTDCSWFVYHVLHKYGLLSSFVHSYEWGNNPGCYPGGVNIGSDLSKASPGDVLCTGTGTRPQNSHVMIYLGGNKAVECAAGHGVQITSIYGSVREIVHFTALPKNTSGTFTASSASTSVGITTTSGKWEKTSAGWKYSVGSSYVKSRFYSIGTKTYYFDKNGIMKTGWQKISGKTYYFDTSGVLLRRWKRINGKKYLFDYVDGHLHTGWVYCDDTSGWYYMNPSDKGAMMYSWQKISGKWYYLNPDNGKMQTGWKKIGSKWYLLASNGEMKTGWQKVKGKWYYMNSSGVMLSNCKVQKDGKTVTLGADGAMK